MKIAFVGKGGSGKTTLASLFARYLASGNFPVLAIDADINQHLGVMLGMPEKEAAAIPPMGIQVARIKEYLRGTNPYISSSETMVKTTPPGPGSRLLTIAEANPIYEYFERSAGGVRLMATGPFTEEDLGVKCYHSKVGAVELFLNHLIDGKGEYVLVDMTAGADTFASGMFTKFDVTFLVLEPTIHSVSVFRQYLQYAEGYGVQIYAVGNKVENDDDVRFLKEHAGDRLLGYVARSGYVRSISKGERLPIGGLEPENIRALDRMKEAVDRQEKDWDKFYMQTIQFHVKNAESWASAAVGEDIRKQADASFPFPSIASRLAI